MKNIWKIISLDKHDVLVEKTQEDGDENAPFKLQVTVCFSLGNTATLGFTVRDERALDEAFEKTDKEMAANLLRFILNSMDGSGGVFENGGPDEIEVTLKPT